MHSRSFYIISQILPLPARDTLSWDLANLRPCSLRWLGYKFWISDKLCGFVAQTASLRWTN